VWILSGDCAPTVRGFLYSCTPGLDGFTTPAPSGRHEGKPVSGPATELGDAANALTSVFKF